MQSLLVHRKTKVCCLSTIGLAADKDENLLLTYKTLDEC